MDRNPDLLIAAQPTRGLDVGAIEFVHKRLIEQRDSGKAVLLISFELDEIINVSDKIAVIFEGSIIAIVDPKETTEQELGLLMAGSTQQEVGKKQMSNRLTNLLIPLIAIVLGLFVGAIIMLASGYSVIEGYSALWNGVFGETYYMGETIRQVTPYILSGLAVAFAFRTGLFNIGVEGQMLIGWVAAVWIGTTVHAPMYIHLPLALITAAVAGALWGFIPGFLKLVFTYMKSLSPS